MIDFLNEENNKRFKTLATLTRRGKEISYEIDKYKGWKGIFSITRSIVYMDPQTENIRARKKELFLPIAIADYLLRALYLK